MSRPTLSLKTLFRTLVILSIPVLVVFLVLLLNDEIGLVHFLLGYGFVLLLSGIMVQPILSNLAALTDYVRDLSQDKKTKAPDLGVLNISSDLSSALVQLQRNWQEKKQQMESVITEREILVDTLPDMLIMTDEELRIVRTNRSARLMFGQNLAGKHLSDIFESDVLINAVITVVESLKGREVDFHIAEPEPKDIHAIIERFPIASKGGMAVIITLNDITQLKRIQKMRADFVANASHEIRTPLTSIAGLIELLQGPAKDDMEAHPKFLGMMAEQSERMKNLITDLLSLSKIEMNAHTVPVSAVEISRVIRHERDHFEWAAKQKNITIEVDVAENLPKIRGEENELKQVLHNLIGNAIKYGNDGSEVLVTARVTSDLPRDPHFVQTKRAMQITVRDEGEGISKEHLPRLTERFYRVDSARTRKVGGTGLGLAIVKHILQRHRAVMKVESVVGEGSSFHVYIPLSE
ncbi:MAG: ATP-binding protein [Rickettsiales bacterium]|nr:ATP-binding protein [Rickettsiales bacterium]